MTAGYKALTKAAATIDLSARTRIRVTGDDRARLLHALTTNHIQQLLPGHGCYAFFLNANGRIQADANILVFAEHILIDAEPEVRESLYAHIDRYIIADDVNLHDESDATFCIAVEGPAAHKRMHELGAPSPGNAFEHQAWDDLTVAHLSCTGEPGFRIFGPSDRKQPLLDLLYLTPAGSVDAETVRIEHGRPRFGADITPTTLAAETGQTQALHFQKGCYLGQEIVERVRSRGHVNKRLVTLAMDAEGTKVEAEGKEAGEITSSAASPALGRFAAIAMVRVPNDQPGTVVSVGGHPAQVRAIVAAGSL